MPLKTNDSFCLQIRPVDLLCHGHKTFDASGKTITLVSPEDTLNNGTILPECRWVIQHPDSKQVLGIQFVKLLFDSAIDIIAINDGPSELSTPLVQVTASSGNLTKYQLVRSTGPFMWVSYKPNTYASELSAIVQAHGQGGHFNGSGSIVMNPDPSDAVFLLEVPENEMILLQFDEKSSNFPAPATLSVYDGFDKTNLLATLHGKVWYPVISKSSKMMLIASKFDAGSFKADFKGMPASCLHMSSFTDENYVLSGNCNKTCLWVVPPQDQPNSNLVLNLQYLNMNKKDTIKIRKLDAAQTILGDISTGVSHVPQMMVPAEIGALVEIGRAACEKENSDIVVVGHSSYLPGKKAWYRYGIGACLY
ncbi:hypothetical protein JTE90_011516 [Oedothorax gibbosus]|uniref:CUB domain-containing protein n=1 Tax=Oedothorax gibbosus TaxID=931172 RepID=A0AAV6TPH4_9ARAC|nr:hypothetical protein JTE90_011516 [Oedothorax gibbosus]